LNGAEDDMIQKRTTLVFEGKYTTEVPVELIEDNTP
jgi:hypothetical protein